MKALRARPPRELEGQERKAGRHILCREHTQESLALAMGVSVPTLARAIARLRADLARRGMMLVSVRAGGSYHYEIRGHAEHVRRKWRESRLRALAGAGKEIRAFRGQDEDDVIYGEE